MTSTFTPAQLAPIAAYFADVRAGKSFAGIGTAEVLARLADQGTTVTPEAVEAVRSAFYGGFWHGADELAQQAVAEHQRRTELAAQINMDDPAAIAQHAQDHADSGGTFRIGIGGSTSGTGSAS